MFGEPKAMATSPCDIPILISFVLEMQQVNDVSSRAYKAMAEWDKARNLQGV